MEIIKSVSVKIEDMPDRYDVASGEVICPICRTRVKNRGTAVHFRNRHPDIDYTEYKELFVPSTETTEEAQPISEQDESRSHSGLSDDPEILQRRKELELLRLEMEIAEARSELNSLSARGEPTSEGRRPDPQTDVRDYDYEHRRCPWCRIPIQKGRGCFNLYSHDDNARGIYECVRCGRKIAFLR